MSTRHVPTGRVTILCEIRGQVRELHTYRWAWRAKRHLKTLRDAGVDAWIKPETRTIFEE
nr:MAG TPA: hypothetical protein [Caudoviricetes sp.]